MKYIEYLPKIDLSTNGHVERVIMKKILTVVEEHFDRNSSYDTACRYVCSEINTAARTLIRSGRDLDAEDVLAINRACAHLTDVINARFEEELMHLDRRISGAFISDLIESVGLLAVLVLRHKEKADLEAFADFCQAQYAARYVWPITSMVEGLYGEVDAHTLGHISINKLRHVMVKQMIESLGNV